MNVEIEIKAHLKNRDAVKKKLQERGAVFESTKQTTDTYYHKKGETTYHQDWHLRIRAYDHASSGRLEYHQPLGEIHAEEYELEVDNVQTMDHILQHLGYKKALIVDKTRETWKLNDFTIALDHVKDEGDFIEVELLNADVKEAEEKIEQFLLSLGITKEDFCPDLRYYQMVPVLTA